MIFIESCLLMRDSVVKGASPLSDAVEPTKHTKRDWPADFADGADQRKDWELAFHPRDLGDLWAALACKWSVVGHSFINFDSSAGSGAVAASCFNAASMAGANSAPRALTAAIFPSRPTSTVNGIECTP